MTDGRISTNFILGEFEMSDTARAKGIDNTMPRGGDVEKAVRELVRTVLQPLRTAWGMPLAISSGYRSEALNRAVGGVRYSQHLIGEAADIRVSGQADAYNLASLAKSLGLPFDQMGLSSRFVHISHKLRGTQRGQVYYYKDYGGAKL